MTKKAFTLAEVLITLAIIGVVAAMTIPTLITNYQDKTWSTSAQVFERKLEEGLKTMNTQQSLAGYRNTADFAAELAKHFKITRICNSNEIASCFNDKINWEVLDVKKNTESEAIDMTTIKNAADLGQEDWNSETVGVQFANGTTGILAYNPDCKENPYTNQFSGISCISLIYDTNGFKKPNTHNKDVRSINAKLMDCGFKVDGTCFSAPFLTGGLSKTECEELKNDLSIKECNAGRTDYWAGAVKACGGMDKMPTPEDLRALAEKLYSTSISSEKTTYNVHLNTQLAIKLGFTPGSSGIFYIWRNDDGYEYHNKGWRPIRFFYPTNTGQGIISAYSNQSGSLYTICKTE